MDNRHPVRPPFLAHSLSLLLFPHGLSSCEAEGHLLALEVNGSLRSWVNTVPSAKPYKTPINTEPNLSKIGSTSSSQYLTPKYKAASTLRAHSQSGPASLLLQHNMETGTQVGSWGAWNLRSTEHHYATMAILNTCHYSGNSIRTANIYVGGGIVRASGTSYGQKCLEPSRDKGTLRPRQSRPRSTSEISHFQETF